MKTSTGETAHVNGHSDHGKDYKSSIGLPNIYRRLKLTFGDQAEMLLRSKEYYYTVVELQIPIEKAGE
jgi:sensor histidine kinase YesM